MRRKASGRPGSASLAQRQNRVCATGTTQTDTDDRLPSHTPAFADVCAPTDDTDPEGEVGEAGLARERGVPFDPLAGWLAGWLA